MDFKTFLTAFSTIFLAEIGDKTQLAVITLSASSKKPMAVLTGAILALSAVTAIGVLFGEGIIRVVPEIFLKRGAALLFIGIGVWMWFKP